MLPRGPPPGSGPVERQERQNRGSPGLGRERAPAGLGEKLQQQSPDVRGAGVCEAGPRGGDAGRQEEDLPLADDGLQAQLLLQLRHAHGLAQVLGGETEKPFGAARGASQHPAPRHPGNSLVPSFVRERGGPLGPVA